VGNLQSTRMLVAAPGFNAVLIGSKSALLAAAVEELGRMAGTWTAYAVLDLLRRSAGRNLAEPHALPTLS